MAHIYRLIAMLSLLSSFGAWASVPFGTQYSVTDAAGWFSTEAAACAAMKSLFPAASLTFAIESPGVCVRRENGNYPSEYNIRSRTSSTCPDNSTLNGGSCTCNAGFNEENGQCVGGMSSEVACGVALYNNGNASSREVNLDGNIPDGTYCEPQGDDIQPGLACAMNFQKDIGWKTDDGNWHSRGTLQPTMIGGKFQPCVPGLDANNGGNTTDKPIEIPKKQDPACPNGYAGQVGGETKCIPSYGYNGVDFAPKTTTKENDKTRTETTTKTECASGKCTTTVTEKVTDKATGQSTTSSNSTTEVDRDWCAKAENKDQCASNGKPAYSGQGTGTSGNGGGDGDEDDKGGRCGGKNQPKCKIDEEGTPKSDGLLDDAKAESNKAHQERMDELGKIQNKGDKDTSMGFNGGFSWLTHKACMPWDLGQMDVAGESIKLEVNICVIEPYVTAVMNFLWILGTLFMTVSRVFTVMTGSRGD